MRPLFFFEWSFFLLAPLRFAGDSHGFGLTLQGTLLIFNLFSLELPFCYHHGQILSFSFLRF